MIASLETLLVVLLLEVNCCLVVQVGYLVFIHRNGLVVELKGLLELLLLVVLIALVLLDLGHLLACNPILLFLWQRVLFVFLALLLLLGPLLGLLFVSLLARVLRLLLALHLLRLHVHQVDPRDLLEHVHHPRVRLHQLHHHLRVLLTHVELVAELRILEVVRNARVLHQLRLSLGAKHPVVLGLSRRLLLAARIQTLLDLRIVRVKFEALLVSCDGLIEFAELLKCHGTSLVTLVPV